MDIPWKKSDLGLLANTVEDKFGLRIKKDDYQILAKYAEKHFENHDQLTDFINSSLKIDIIDDLYQDLLDQVTVKKTDFFRRPNQFDLLKKCSIPEIIKEKKLRNDNQNLITIWSAACCSGEEPYSLAMTLLESVPAPYKFKVVATDLNPEYINEAQRGIYPSSVLSKVPERHHKYFKKLGNRVQVDDLLKDYIDFYTYNLNSIVLPKYKGLNWDIIFCRNVMIYFDREKVKQILEKFYQIMNWGSYLFLGDSESLFKVFNKLSLINFEDEYVYKKQIDFQEEDNQPAKPFKGSGKYSFSKIKTKLVHGVGINGVKEQFIQQKEQEKPLKPAKLSNPDQLYQKQVNRYNETNFQSCLEEFSRLREQFPKHREISITLGNLYAFHDFFKKAEDIYLSLLNQQIMEPELHFLLGDLYKNMDKIELAIAAFKKVIYLQEEHFLAYFNLAILYFSQKDFQNANRYFKNALEFSYPEKSPQLLRSFHPQYSDMELTKKSIFDSSENYLSILTLKISE